MYCPDYGSAFYIYKSENSKILNNYMENISEKAVLYFRKGYDTYLHNNTFINCKSRGF